MEGLQKPCFEGIDALELHYKGSNHEKVPECVADRDRLLQLVGFTSVTYAQSDEIETAARTTAPHPTGGYIASRNADPFARPAAFVSVGKTFETDAGDICLTP